MSYLDQNRITIIFNCVLSQPGALNGLLAIENVHRDSRGVYTCQELRWYDGKVFRNYMRSSKSKPWILENNEPQAY